MAKKDFCDICGAPLSLVTRIKIKDGIVCHDCYEKAGYGFMARPASIEVEEVKKRIEEPMFPFREKE